MLVLVGLFGLLILPFYWRGLPAPWRPAAFTFVGLAALAAFEPLSVAVLAATTVACWLVVRGNSSRARLSFAVLGVAVALLAQKWLALQGLALVGFSYASFRLIHLALDRAAGRVPALGLPAFVEYAMFPAYFLSGPIARYQEHVGGAALERLSLDEALWGMGRVLIGLAKKVLLASPLLRLADVGFAADGGGAQEAWLALLAYSLGIYLDFSGYTDVALGGARLFGFRGPENFDWPYLASDIGEFWRRWHITLSNWLRDYVFLRSAFALSRSDWWSRRPLLTGSASSLLAMGVCGLWHGLTPSFLLWGLGHGALIALHQLYRQRLLARLPPARKRWLRVSVAYRAVATVVTFLAVTLLWVLFRLPLTAAAGFLGRLFGA